jgi:hypothetical protein
MIDWANLGANALWILGCAIALATLSYANWQAAIHEAKIAAWLTLPGYMRALAFAGIFFCAGQVFLAEALVPRLLFALLCVMFVVVFALSYRR